MRRTTHSVERRLAATMRTAIRSAAQFERHKRFTLGSALLGDGFTA
jgi:hypothetical protein